MGRLTEYMAVLNMTAEERKKYVYGTNRYVYLSYIDLSDDFLKTHKPLKK
jgi:hypothetical protein